MTTKAWELERKMRDEAIPVDRRVNESDWFEADFVPPYGDDLIALFWSSKVPGSRAPEIPYQEMVQSMDNLGYDVSKAEALIPQGIALRDSGDKTALRALTSELLYELKAAQKIPGNAYDTYTHPETWEEIRAAMPAAQDAAPAAEWNEDFTRKTYQGWIGQLAGGAFGTAIEGYTGEKIASVYGEINGYVTTPETTNDDVVYELVLLDVFERMGNSITSKVLALEWVKQIPFGWSAEWVALRNLAMGIFPPESGSFMNPYYDWIGVQMRGMIGGLLKPANPMEAARLATIDGVVSHARNGVYGGIFAAVLTSLAYQATDTRELLFEAARYIPAGSEYAAKLDFVLETLQAQPDPVKAFPEINKHFEQYNWIHAYPNMAADVYALWYGEGDFGKSMALLAKAGNDVDCNAGLVGTVLGVMKEVPAEWADPIGDVLETYISGKEKLSIKALAEKTASLAKRYY